MGEMKFTPSQRSAIETNDKTLLVSACAGSGKTTVLTQRILEHLRGGSDIMGLLVVTFTKAAASQLKSKLYDALLKASAENPGDKHITHNLYMLPSAKISTIHSFCFETIKNNFAHLNLSPSVRIADAAEMKIMLDDCLEALIDSEFASGNGDFITLCNAFTNEKSLKDFKATVTGIYNKYRSFPFWKNYVEKASSVAGADLKKATESAFFACEAGNKLINYIISTVKEYREKTNDLIKTISAVAQEEKTFEAAEYAEKYLNGLIDLLERENPNYEEIQTFLFGYDSPRASYKGLDADTKKYYEDTKKEISVKIKEYQTWFSSASQSHVADYESSVKLNDIMNSFIAKLDENYTDAKRKRGILDYSDLEQLTLSLLGEPTPNGIVRTEICNDLRGSIKEVYIDEYQDINPLQDCIFKLISNDTNRFMVGDVKQSIYRFRNASSDIFLKYLSEFNGIDDKESKNAKIFLSENHRSKKPILDFVNLIFDELYTIENVGASYENERLIHPEKNDEGGVYPVEICTFGEGESPSVDEAEFVADKIYDLVNKEGYSYGDIAVILRSVTTNGIEYERSFRKRGIPYKAGKNTNFLLLPEILLAVSVLRTMDDKLDDISLAGAMRSPIFRFTADDLYAVKRYYGYYSLYDCIKKCALFYGRDKTVHRYICNKPIPKNIKMNKRIPLPPHSKSVGEKPGISVGEKCIKAIEMLDGLEKIGSECPSSKLIWQMYIKTGLVSLCACESGGEEKVKNLYALYSYALNYEKTSFKGLSGFLNYLERIAGSEDEGLSADEDGSEKVKIITIHQSKGIEYPVCFVSACGKEINTDDTKKKYIISESGFTYYDLRSSDGFFSYTPLVKENAAFEEKKAIFREELRCLYVALTRAKERLYITGTVSRGANGKCGFFSAHSYMSWIYPIVKSKNAAFFNLYEDPKISEEKKYDGQVKATASLPYELFEKALSFGYDKGDGRQIPSKAAVSELRSAAIKDENYTKSVAKSEGTKKPCFASAGSDYAAIGTSTHLFMQFASFENVIKNGVKQEIERLLANRTISETDALQIDRHSVEKFFAGDLCREIMNSSKVFREKRFNLIEKSNLLGGDGNENVMIQGVIDCFYKNPDGTYTVVDYKTDRIKSEEQLIERHSFQIKYYCRAVELMTGEKVSKAHLYSFALGRSAEVNLES